MPRQKKQLHAVRGEANSCRRLSGGTKELRRTWLFGAVCLLMAFGASEVTAEALTTRAAVQIDGEQRCGEWDFELLIHDSSGHVTSSKQYGDVPRINAGIRNQCQINEQYGFDDYDIPSTRAFCLEIRSFFAPDPFPVHVALTDPDGTVREFDLLLDPDSNLGIAEASFVSPPGTPFDPITNECGGPTTDDMDADGVDDYDDACPTEPGMAPSGCPPPPRKPDRTLSLKYSKKHEAFFGKIRSDLGQCRRGAVTVYEVRPGKDKKVGKDQAPTNGKWLVKHSLPDGSYKARTPELTAGSKTCPAVGSKSIELP